jgi:hypothetical protein
MTMSANTNENPGNSKQIKHLLSGIGGRSLPSVNAGISTVLEIF